MMLFFGKFDKTDSKVLLLSMLLGKPCTFSESVWFIDSWEVRMADILTLIYSSSLLSFVECINCM